MRTWSNAVERGFDQRLLVEEVLVAVADQAQLGEHRQRHVPRRGPLGEVDGLRGVVPGIGEAEARIAAATRANPCV